MDGIINIYKEKGYTSHDAVAKLMRITGAAKAGHAGTLDPAAEGVLPICVGKATKLCEYLSCKDKEYLCRVRLGITTDTLDMTGNIVGTRKYEGDESGIKAAVKTFEGDIMQTPPMYSAVRSNGKKLYELARKNIEVERKSRPVRIYSLTVSDIDLTGQEFTLRARVSKGTYIRSLCDDIGKTLGCGACMSELVRLRSGVFDIKESITLKRVEDIMREGGTSALSEYVLPIGDAFAVRKTIMKSEYDARVKNGNPISPDMFSPYEKEGKAAPFIHLDGSIAVYLSDGTFKAVYKENGGNGYSALKMF